MEEQAGNLANAVAIFKLSGHGSGQAGKTVGVRKLAA
jgi:hypothetical protein